MKTSEKLSYDKLGPKVVKALKSRSFEAWYFSHDAEAVEKVFSLIPKTDIVSWGGSLTATELGLAEIAVQQGYNVIDRYKASSQDEKKELMRQALLCDTYMTGTNAISEDGQLFNIDGYGNRVAALTLGPKQVIVVVGMNKVKKTPEEAIVRARSIAASMNAQHSFGTETSVNEKNRHISVASICYHFVHIRICKPKGRIKVILIGRDFGL